MTQTEARRRAKELGGIATTGRDRGDHWLLGGWPSTDAVWIVISLDRAFILDA